jgi:Dynein heavy chain, N-terminal region 1
MFFQLIGCCKRAVYCGKPSESVWDQPPVDVLTTMEQCLKLNEAYQGCYRATKDKLTATLKGRQFEFAEDQVRGCFSPKESVPCVWVPDVSAWCPTPCRSLGNSTGSAGASCD